MQSNIDLKGLRIAVTGGTSGLGLALVKTLRTRGARVAFVARSAASVKRVARGNDRLRRPRRRRAARRTSTRSRSRVDLESRRPRRADQQRLEPRTDGRSRCSPTPNARILVEAFAVNLIGPFRLTKALFGALGVVRARGPRRRRRRHFERRGGHRHPGSGAYGASKAALRPPDGDLGRGGEGRGGGSFSRSTPATWIRLCTPWPCPTPIRQH